MKVATDVSDIERCPEIEHAPMTAEGRAVLEAIDRYGVWKRAGFGGQIYGLDLPEAMASVPVGLDRDFVQRLFLCAEPGYLAGILSTIENKD